MVLIFVTIFVECSFGSDMGNGYKEYTPPKKIDAVKGDD